MNGLSRVAVKRGDTDYDFNVYSMGLESTEPGKSVGPCVRSKYVIHYIFDGRGSFNGAPISRGDGFLICPNQLHHYVSDDNEPLKYGWISFFGYDAEKLLREVGFELENQIFRCSWIDDLDGIFKMLCRNGNDGIDTEKYLEGCFSILLSFHLKAYNDRISSAGSQSLIRDHVATAVKFVNDNYCHKISVSDVASACFVSAHYLSNIFKKEMDISPQRYIVEVRMRRAEELLRLDTLSITDVALSVGYPDVLAFSKMFRKNFGISPSEYRKKIMSE